MSFSFRNFAGEIRDKKDMPKFAIYAYEFKPVYNAPEFDFPDWDKIDADESFKKRDDILKKILGLEDLKFCNGDYDHRMYIRKGDVTVLRIANNSKLQGENNFTKFEVPNHPSCHILIDHHKQSQHIAIQMYKKAFTKTETVVKILEETLNHYLISYKLQIKLFAKTYKHGFWQMVDKFPNGIYKVRFIFPYPNMGKVANLAGPLMRKLSEVTNGDAIAESHSRGVEALTIDPNDPTMQDWVAATSAAGSAELQPKGENRWRQVDKESMVMIDFPKGEFNKLPQKDLFDLAYDYSCTWLGNISLVYE